MACMLWHALNIPYRQGKFPQQWELTPFLHVTSYLNTPLCGIVCGTLFYGKTEPWRWSQYILPKRWYIPASPHGITAYINRSFLLVHFTLGWIVWLILWISTSILGSLSVWLYLMNKSTLTARHTKEFKLNRTRQINCPGLNVSRSRQFCVNIGTLCEYCHCLR